jgi:hypothetical protein
MDTTQHEAEPLANDLLVGAEKIRAFLISLGWPPTCDPYYLRKKKWPIGKSSDGQSARLVASKRRLARFAQKITAPQKNGAA